MMIKILKNIFILFIITNSVISYSDDKFKIDGNILHYNTNLASDEIEQEITFEDVDKFREILKKNPSLEIVHITSWGGMIDASVDIADLIIDYELDTHVKEICFSACPIIFLGGETRTLDRGSKIGFHRGYWTSEDMRDYYEDKETQEYYGWKNPYDFSSWIYESTQEDIYKQFKYYLERGVESSFVIETMRARSDDGWYPRRKELLKANFLTE